MITLLIGGLFVLWIIKMSFIEVSRGLFEDESVSETETV